MFKGNFRFIFFIVKFKKLTVGKTMMGPNFMNLRYVAEQPVAGSNLNQQFKVKDSGRS